jgi:hypothetical protein
MSFVDNYRSLIVTSIHLEICPALLDAEFASLVSWHAQTSWLSGEKGRTQSAAQWEFPKRHQATKASYVLWLLFNAPSDDHLSFIKIITTAMRNIVGN